MTDATAKALIVAIERLTDAVEKLTRQMDDDFCRKCDGSGRISDKYVDDTVCPACSGSGGR